MNSRINSTLVRIPGTAVPGLCPKLDDCQEPPMRFSLPCVVLTILLAAGNSLAQEKGDKTVPIAKAPTSNIEVRFADGSVVKMALLESKVEIATRYGKLSVPVEDIRRIEFGFRVS